MKVIGIIAEYNPFHNGHAYQIKKIKEELQADYVVVVMSGDFVQRGAPAIIDKYARTKMALSCGADLVIELPVLWATASAEYFAMAGVTLLDKMGCVDGICFGAENDDLITLSMLADILVDEPEHYRASLSSYLKIGMAFPAARSKALCDYLAQEKASYSPENNKIHLDEVSSILNEPNNILAIEYLKALKRRNSSMTPYVNKREGAGYHDSEIFSGKADIPTASATAIRKELIASSTCTLLSKDTASNSNLLAAIPASVLAILDDYLATETLIECNDFSSILGYQLLSSDGTILEDIGDANMDLANRIFQNRMLFSNFEQFCELCKSKDVTYTRLSRIFTHLILRIRTADYDHGKALDYIPYLRILGFNKESSLLLKELKKHAKVPVISKLANASSILNADAMLLLQKDIFAADLYSQICAIKKNTPAASEFTRNIVRK